KAVQALEPRRLAARRLAGEMIADRKLALRQHAHAEHARLADLVVHAGTAADRDQHQGRLQRARHEGIRGHRVRVAVELGRDDDDAGRELAHGVAELALVERAEGSGVLLGDGTGIDRRHGGTRWQRTTDRRAQPRRRLMRLMSSGFTRSGTVQPSRSYSSIADWAKALKRSRFPSPCAAHRLVRRVMSLLPM